MKATESPRAWAIVEFFAVSFAVLLSIVGLLPPNHYDWAAVGCFWAIACYSRLRRIP